MALNPYHERILGKLKIIETSLASDWRSAFEAGVAERARRIDAVRQHVKAAIASMLNIDDGWEG
jgi:hypothetical protein